MAEVRLKTAGPPLKIILSLILTTIKTTRTGSCCLFARRMKQPGGRSGPNGSTGSVLTILTGEEFWAIDGLRRPVTINFFSILKVNSTMRTKRVSTVTVVHCIIFTVYLFYCHLSPQTSLSLCWNNDLSYVKLSKEVKEVFRYLVHYSKPPELEFWTYSCCYHSSGHIHKYLQHHRWAGVREVKPKILQKDLFHPCIHVKSIHIENT